MNGSPSLSLQDKTTAETLARDARAHAPPPEASLWVRIGLRSRAQGCCVGRALPACAPQHGGGALMQHGDELAVISLAEIGQSLNPGLTTSLPSRHGAQYPSEHRSKTENVLPRTADARALAPSRCSRHGSQSRAPPARPARPSHEPEAALAACPSPCLVLRGCLELPQLLG